MLGNDSNKLIEREKKSIEFYKYRLDLSLVGIISFGVGNSNQRKIHFDKQRTSAGEEEVMGQKAREGRLKKREKDREKGRE